MDRLDELRLFLAIVDSGQFAAAGRKFARSPSSKTRIVAELERRLGTRLLQRTTRKLSLTDSGARLAAQARRLLADYDDAIDGAIGEAASLRGNIKLSAPTLFGSRHGAPLVRVKKRKRDAVDYPVMALEGLWWVEDGIFDITIKDNWSYTLMILQPDIITPELFEQAREQVCRKKGETPALARARLAAFQEGLCVQALHIGPYATEPETIERMRAYMQENGLQDNVGPDSKHTRST